MDSLNRFEIGDQEFKHFRELIYDESGINLSDMKKALLQARLSKRLRILHLHTFNEYYTYLKDNYEEEKINLINAITTNKTDFFRENKHFEFMANEFLPDFKGDELRIWSAGCSTGEEPYSIAMTLSQYYDKKKSPLIRILATDIDTQVLSHGRDGVYKTDRIQDVPVDILKEYFYRGSGDNEGYFKAKDALRNIISFRQLNLQSETYPMKKKFHLIFCRNVIIYFDKETQKRLFDKIYNYLHDDGYLFIGHSENLNNITDKYLSIGHTIYVKRQ